VLSITHLILFCYYCAIAYEYYQMACDDPAMIEAEHRAQAASEKKAAADRKSKQNEELKKNLDAEA